MQIFWQKKLHNSKKSCNFAAKFKTFWNMDYEETIKVLRDIANKNDKLTSAEKGIVQDLCVVLGIKFEPKSTRCKSCYQDAALQCYNEVMKRAAAEGEENDERCYILRDGVDVLFGSIRVNAATLTDELGERIIARGFDKKFFLKCK